MTNLIIPQGEGHWYASDGTPVYEVPRKDGKGSKATTVREAVELNLYPSVTGILGMVTKPALENWKIQQYVMSALTLPRLESDSIETLAKRVVSDAQIEGQRAAVFGTTLHALVESYLKDDLQNQMLGPVEQTWLQSIIPWFTEHKVEPLELEYSFCDTIEGYAGRLDFLGFIDGVFVVADWKTQATKPDKPVTIYPEWGVQLEAYRRGAQAYDALSFSFVISSTEPGRVQPYLWLKDSWYWDCFQAAKVLYYSPLGRGYKLVTRKVDDDDWTA